MKNVVRNELRNDALRNALDKLNELNLNELHSHSLDLNQESLY